MYPNDESLFIDTLDCDVTSKLDYSKLVSESIDARGRASSVCVHILFALLKTFKKFSATLNDLLRYIFCQYS